MLCAVELCDSFDLDVVGPGAFYPSAHLVDEVGQVCYLRLFSGILYVCRAVRECCSHHDILCSAYAWEVQIDSSSDKSAFRCLSFYIVICYHDLCAERFKAFKMQVDRPRAYTASSRPVELCLALAAEKRSHHDEGRAHHTYELIIRLDGFDRLGLYVEYGSHGLVDH